MSGCSIGCPDAPSDRASTGVPLEIGPGPSAGPAADGVGPRGPGRVAPREALHEVRSDAPREDAERLLRAFLNRTYRRPVAEADVQRFLGLFDDQFRKGFGFSRSMLSAYTAVLASPGFVFVEEKPGRLDDHALAYRLSSYFLRNLVPDEALLFLAAVAKLQQAGRAARRGGGICWRTAVATVRRGRSRGSG